MKEVGIIMVKRTSETLDDIKKDLAAIGGKLADLGTTVGTQSAAGAARALKKVGAAIMATGEAIEAIEKEKPKKKAAPKKSTTKKKAAPKKVAAKKKCAAVTASGKPCSNFAVGRSKYCAVHKGGKAKK